MRILSGALRGRTLLFKPSANLRPTSDKAKKAIFDMLRDGVEEKRVLDLYSGTGALGFEALSCGAGSVVFVESDKKQAALIHENLKKLKLEEKAEVICADARTALRNFSKKGARFDAVFMDPPYDGEGQEAFGELTRSGILNEGGLAVVECRKTEDYPTGEPASVLLQTKLYGDTKVLIYRRRPKTGPQNG